MEYTYHPQSPDNSGPIHDSGESNELADRYLAAETSGVRTTDDLELLRSIDMVFRLQQRSEEIRSHLEKIDRVLLSSRTVAGLTRAVVELLEHDLDLVAARILFKENHPLGALLLWDPPEGAGMIPADFLEGEGLSGTDPFILDDLSGELSATLFGECSPLVASAALAVLSVDNTELGVLCLGSDDPGRYRGGMNTEIIASLADKIALGIRNAWDHEKLSEDALCGTRDGVVSEAFFREALQWEFHRAWRYGRPFALLGLSWRDEAEETITSSDVKEVVRRNLRSCDLVSEGDDVKLWVMLPEVGIEGARAAAERLVKIFQKTFAGRLMLHAGLTEYSTAAAVSTVLIRTTRQALEEARGHEAHAIVVREVDLLGKPLQGEVASLVAP
ncbi:MAG: DUF484 family protein [Desulfomonile sp.]|nr:DUF484 family protein [Desulfomonile sp.]